MSDFSSAGSAGTVDHSLIANAAFSMNSETWVYYTDNMVCKYRILAKESDLYIIEDKTKIRHVFQH